MKPILRVTAICVLLFFYSLPQAVAQSDYSKELEANFKNVLGKLWVLSGNTDPSILVEGSGKGSKYNTSLIVIPGAIHTIDFSGTAILNYRMEAALDDSAKSRAYFNFLASLGKTYIDPQSFTVEYRVSDGQPNFTWVTRVQSAGRQYQYTILIGAKTRTLSGQSFYMTNFWVTKQECTFVLRDGLAEKPVETVSYATLIDTLSGNLNNRFRSLSRFARAYDSTEFSPSMLLNDFTDGKSEKHTIYNNFWAFKDQLKYEAIKYFPDNEQSAEQFFHKVAQTLNVVCKTKPVETTYLDRKSLKYEWFCEMLPYKVILNYYPEGLFSRQVNFQFISSPELVTRLELKKSSDSRRKRRG